MPVTLKVVASTNNPKTSKKWQGYDDVFLHRNQIRIGLMVENFGRLDHGSRWKVTHIYTHTESGRRRSVDTLKHSTDIIELRNVDTDEKREMMFVNLSYSAIWRLPR